MGLPRREGVPWGHDASRLLLVLLSGHRRGICHFTLLGQCYPQGVAPTSLSLAMRQSGTPQVWLKERENVAEENVYRREMVTAQRLRLRIEQA